MVSVDIFLSHEGIGENCKMRDFKEQKGILKIKEEEDIVVKYKICKWNIKFVNKNIKIISKLPILE